MGRTNAKKYLYYDFFSGGGMLNAGLGKSWKCVFANDIDERKAYTYIANWGDNHLLVKDIADIKLDDLTHDADLSWASFPCQDLSLAGSRNGLNSKRSGTFWIFWSLMQQLNAKRRGPKIIVLENVVGALTSHQGMDFAAIASAISNLHYKYGAVVIDAAHFVPQSRPRLFIIAAREDIQIPSALSTNNPHDIWHTQAIRSTYSKLSPKATKYWLWWNIPKLKTLSKPFDDLIEDEPSSVDWHTLEMTGYLLSLMSDVNIMKVEVAKKEGTRRIGTIYRRSRNGHQKAEVRFDGIAGCLRTPVGGSSRQILIFVEGESIRTRLLSPREAARLMGLPDSYILPKNNNAAYHLTGDGVVVPVIKHLRKTVFKPILEEYMTKAG